MASNLKTILIPIVILSKVESRSADRDTLSLLGEGASGVIVTIGANLNIIPTVREGAVEIRQVLMIIKSGLTKVSPKVYKGVLMVIALLAEVPRY